MVSRFPSMTDNQTDLGDYDPDSILEQFNEVASGEYEQKATIVSVEQSTAGEVFGEKIHPNQDPDDPVIHVTAEYETEDGETKEVNETFGMAKSALSWVNSQFKLGRFIEQYGEPPQEGMEVLLRIDGDYLNIFIPESHNVGP